MLKNLEIFDMKNKNILPIMKFLFSWKKSNLSGLVFSKKRRGFHVVFFWFLLGFKRFYSFWTVNEFPSRSRGENRSSESEHLKIFSNISRVTFSFNILALFSPRTRIQTRSRLSPIFLWSFGFNPNSIFAFTKGNHLWSNKNEIKSDFSTPSIASFGSFSCGCMNSTCGINFHIFKKAETIVSKNANKFKHNIQQTNIRFEWMKSKVWTLPTKQTPKINAQMIHLSHRRTKFWMIFHFSIDLTIFVFIAFLIMIF